MPAVPVDPDAPVGAPLYPPKEWFQKPPQLERGAKIAVITDGPDAGRVFGYVAPNKQCILSGREKQECWQVPSSPTNYAAAMQGDTLTAEGELVRTANVGGDVDHAPITWQRFEKVRDHYANTASQVMRVVYGQDDYGVWAAGALWPEITHRQAAKVRASALSGDWRWRQEFGTYDMAGSQMVSVPGFPLIPTVTARAASASDSHPAIIGGFGGIPQETTMDTEPTVTLTLTASETARLHAILTGSAPIVPPAAAVASACACGGHSETAAAEPPMIDESTSVPDPTADLAGRVEQLERQVEELIGERMAEGLGEVDAMVAAMPLPPDLEDEERWAMPDGRTAAGRQFDESKIRRHEKGTSEGGRFAPKAGDRVKVQTDRGEEEGEVVSKSNTLPGEQDRYTVKFDDGTQSSWNGAQVTRKDIADASTNADGEDGFSAWQREQGELVTETIDGEEVVDPDMAKLRETVDATKKGDWQKANKLNAEALADRPRQIQKSRDYAAEQLALQDKARAEGRERDPQYLAEMKMLRDAEHRQLGITPAQTAREDRAIARAETFEAPKPKSTSSGVKWSGVAGNRGSGATTDDGFVLDVAPDGGRFQWNVQTQEGYDDGGIDPVAMGDAASQEEAQKQAEAALERARKSQS